MSGGERLSHSTHHGPWAAESPCSLCCLVSSDASLPLAKSLQTWEQARCLGYELKAGVPNQQECVAGFVPGQPHLQDKFCRNCIMNGFAVRAAQVRILKDAGSQKYCNDTRGGFWKSTTAPFRVINHHRRCRAPPLVMFRGDVQVEQIESDDASNGGDGALGGVPDDLQADGVIWFRVAYGTLVPIKQNAVNNSVAAIDCRATVGEDAAVLPNQSTTCSGTSSTFFGPSDASRKRHLDQTVCDVQPNEMVWDYLNPSLTPSLGRDSLREYLNEDLELGHVLANAFPGCVSAGSLSPLVSAEDDGAEPWEVFKPTGSTQSQGSSSAQSAINARLNRPCSRTLHLCAARLCCPRPRVMHMTYRDGHHVCMHMRASRRASGDRSVAHPVRPCMPKVKVASVVRWP